MRAVSGLPRPPDRRNISLPCLLRKDASTVYRIRPLSAEAPAEAFHTTPKSKTAFKSVLPITSQMLIDHVCLEVEESSCSCNEQVNVWCLSMLEAEAGGL